MITNTARRLLPGLLIVCACAAGALPSAALFANARAAESPLGEGSDARRREVGDRYLPRLQSPCSCRRIIRAQFTTPNFWASLKYSPKKFLLLIPGP